MSSKLCRRSGFQVAAAIVILVALSITANAQLPPPGAYQPIPNFIGDGAGLQFRTAINNRFSGVQPISPTLINIFFTDFPPEIDGSQLYCNDCQAATPCAGGGTGAWAFGARGIWNCVAGAFSDTTIGGDLSGTVGNATVNTVEGGKTPVTGSYVGALSLSGNSNNGTDQVSNANVNGAINPRAYGAVGISSATTCSTTANSNVITIVPSFLFKNGQVVMCAHAGAANTATAPSALSVVKTDPSGAGTTTWTYKVCTFDGATGQMSGCATASVTNTLSLNSNLSGNNNLLHWTKGTNGSATVIYNQNGVIGLIPIAVTSFRDVGQPVETFNEIPVSAPTVALNRRLSTTIVSGGGTVNLTVTDNATVTVSGQYFSHDDTAAIQAAFAASQSQRTALQFPSGSYNYYGAGLGGTLASYISIGGEPPLMNLAADAPSQSIVNLAAGGYFIDDSALVVQIQLRDMTFIGGHGAVRMTSTAAVGYGERKIYNNAFLGFTGCAVCWNETDDPYHRVHSNRFRGLDTNATTGFGFGGANDGSNIENNTFNNLRVGVADAGVGLGRSYVNNDFIHGLNQPFARTDLWISDNQAGGATISRHRLSTEAIQAGDYHVLVADADSSGSLAGDQFPVAPHANYGTGEIVLDGAIASGAASLSSSTAHFLTSAHVNDWVRVAGAGNQGTCVCELVAQIATVNNDTHVTLGATSTAAVSGAIVFFGTASTLPRVGNVVMSENLISSLALTPPAPWVYTTSAITSGWSIVNNIVNSAVQSGPILQYLPLTQMTPNANVNLIAGNNGIGLGSGSDPSQGLQVSNNVTSGILVDPLVQMSTWNQPAPYQTTVNNAGVTDFLPTPINSFSLGTGVTKTPIADRGGGSDATEVNFSSPTGTSLIRANFTPSVPGLAWVTFDFKQASATPLTHFRASISTSASPGASGATLVSRQLDVPEMGGWYTLSLPFVPTDTSTVLTVAFQPVGIGSTLESGSVDIGRVHVYQHETAADLAGVALTLSTFTAAGLPACVASNNATYATVTDATLASCVAGSALAGGSTNYCLAICKNGTGWVHP